MENFQVIAIGQSNMGLNQHNVEKALKDAYGPGVVLSRCAVGGSSIDEWQPGSPNYVNAVNIVKANQALGYTVKGLFMMHGERDARMGMPRGEYAHKAVTMLSRLHADIGYPWMPVIFGQLGALPVTGFDADKWQAIRWAQQDILIGRPAYKMFQTAHLGPYEAGYPDCHYRDNIADPLWVGTGYKEITYNGFMSRFLTLLPPE